MNNGGGKERHAVPYFFYFLGGPSERIIATNVKLIAIKIIKISNQLKSNIKFTSNDFKLKDLTIFQ